MVKDSKNTKRIDLHNLIGMNLNQENLQKNFLEIEWLLSPTILILFILRHCRIQICIEKIKVKFNYLKLTNLDITYNNFLFYFSIFNFNIVLTMF